MSSRGTFIRTACKRRFRSVRLKEKLAHQGQGMGKKARCEAMEKKNKKQQQQKNQFTIDSSPSSAVAAGRKSSAGDAIRDDARARPIVLSVVRRVPLIPWIIRTPKGHVKRGKRSRGTYEYARHDRCSWDWCGATANRHFRKRTREKSRFFSCTSSDTTEDYKYRRVSSQPQTSPEAADSGVYIFLFIRKNPACNKSTRQYATTIDVVPGLYLSLISTIHFESL